MKRWWSEKYNLPPNHKLFESQSLAEIELEMYEDLLTRKQSIESELHEDQREMNRAEELITQLNAIKRALGEKDEVVVDPLIDQWEKDLEEGRIPDLEAKQ